MASDDSGLVQAQQRLDIGLNRPQLVFPNSFCAPPPPPQRGVSAGDPGPKTTSRELASSFMDQHRQGNYFLHHPTPVDFRRAMFSPAAASSSDRDGNNWRTSGGASPALSADGSEDEDTGEDDYEEDGDRDEEIEVEDFVGVENSEKNNCNTRVNSTGGDNESDEIEVQKLKPLSAICLKDDNLSRRTGNGRSNDETRNSITVANVNGEIYCPQSVQESVRVESSAAPKRSIGVENGCAFGGRSSSELGETLRAILSDPLTGALMDDAMILPCGHSFGNGGIQHVLRRKACYTCSQAVTENSVSPNLSLRAAVQAFYREEGLLFNRSSKRRRERYEQHKGTYGESVISNHPRGRGVRFPFAVSDRVLIQGNKRTPPRFVGREAVVTTQCLNGWYVVKTLDNAESVKLQYRSLAKVPDSPTPMPISSKMPTNWL